MSLCSVGFAVAASGLQADAGTPRILKGTSDVNWDRTTAVWYTSAESTTPVAYGYTLDADTLISSSYFTGSTIYFTGIMMAANVTFDLSQDLLLTKPNTSNNQGLMSGDAVVTKRGAGTLTVASNGSKVSGGGQQGNCGIKKWVIEEGMVKADTTYYGSGWGDYGSINVLGSAYNGLDVDVKSGGSLWLYGRQCTGFPSYSATVEQGEVGARITVHKGASFKTGDASSTYRQYAVRELTLAGGTVELGYGGNVGDDIYGSLKVIDKLAFTDEADAPYVWTPTRTYGNFLFAGSRLTEICVDDITKNADADVTFSQAIKDGTTSRIGFVKTGAGTFVLDSTASTFSGDVIVSNGTLRLGTGSGQYAVNYLGNLNVARTITVEDGGTLDFPHRFQNGGYGTGYESAPIPTSFRIKTGGTLRHSLADQAVNTYGDLWLDGGALEMGLGQIGCGNLLVLGTMKFTGATPYVLASTGRASAQALNGSPATVFDVADITGDAAPDVTYGMALMVSGGFCDNVGTESNKRFVPKNGLKFGFVKRGAGTMRLTYNLNDVSGGWGGLGTPNGDVVVEAGTLQVDNTALADYADSSVTFVVKDGACLSGTGMVRTVSIEQGGGFAATIGEVRSLRLIGTATLPAKGVVRLSNPVVGESIRANLMTVADGATVTGTENLANWDVYVDGALKSDMKVFLAKGVLQVKELRGLSVIFR